MRKSVDFIRQCIWLVLALSWVLLGCSRSPSPSAIDRAPLPRIQGEGGEGGGGGGDPVCGDSECSDPDEDTCSCPEDCGIMFDHCCDEEYEDTLNEGPTCGDSCPDGVCHPYDEDTVSCWEDCGSSDGDGACNGFEDHGTAPSDCDPTCGD